MRKTILFAFALLLVCSDAMAGKRKKGLKKAPQIAWTAFSDDMFHEGTAVLKGQLTGYVLGQNSEVLEVVTFNMFDCRPHVTAIPLQDDGSFEAELALPHSAYFYSTTLNARFFLSVGDTLVMNRTAKGELHFSGSPTSAQVSNLWSKLHKQYYSDAPDASQARDGNLEMLRQVISYNEHKVDSLAKAIADGRLLADTTLTPQAREVLQYGLLSQGMTYILHARTYYSLNQYDYDANEQTGVIRMVPKDSTFVSLESKEFSAFFTKYEQTLLNTPMLLLSPEMSVVLNRLDFDHYNEFLFISWILRHHAISIEECYEETFRQIRSKHGLGRSFATDLFMVYDAANAIKNELPPDEMFAFFAKNLGQVRHPLARRHMLQLYRNYVITHEAPKSREEGTPITDETLLRLLEPYKGNILFVDFWSIGCGPCMSGMLKMREQVEALKDKPVRFLYVSNDSGEGRTRAEQWMQENNIHGEHLFVSSDEWAKLRAYLNFTGIPFCIIVDKEGRMVGTGGHSETKSQHLQKMLEKE